MVSSNNKIMSSRFFEQSQFEQFTMSQCFQLKNLILNCFFSFFLFFLSFFLFFAFSLSLILLYLSVNLFSYLPPRFFVIFLSLSVFLAFCPSVFLIIQLGVLDAIGTQPSVGLLVPIWEQDKFKEDDNIEDQASCEAEEAKKTDNRSSTESSSYLHQEVDNRLTTLVAGVKKRWI